MSYSEPGAWNNADAMYKLQFIKDSEFKYMYSIDNYEIPKAERCSTAMGLYGAAAFTKRCTESELEAFVFGGINTTFGGHMGKPSSEIITYQLQKTYKKNKVKIKIFPEKNMSGDIPKASYGAVLTQISECKLALTGGIMKPYIVAKTGYEILVNNCNIEEEKSVGTLHILEFSPELDNFQWVSKGEVMSPRAHHIAEYIKSIDHLAVLGGLSVTNSSKSPGTRLNVDPILISMTTFTVTSVIRFDPLNTMHISGASSIQVTDREILFFGGYSSEIVHQNRRMNAESNNVCLVKLADDYGSYTLFKKDLNCSGFSMSYVNRISNVEDNHTLFLTLGTKKGHGVFSDDKPNRK